MPYLLADRSSAQLAVRYGNATSPTINARIVAAAPGIFTVDGRQAAALNHDGSVNSEANPALAGSVLVLYLTGEGPTAPAGRDGEIVSAGSLKRPLAAVGVRVNSLDVAPADILYAGSAPGLVSGLMQINFRLPASAAPNSATPVEVQIGGVSLAQSASPFPCASHNKVAGLPSPCKKAH